MYQKPEKETNLSSATFVPPADPPHRLLGVLSSAPAVPATLGESYMNRREFITLLGDAAGAHEMIEWGCLLHCMSPELTVQLPSRLEFIVSDVDIDMRLFAQKVGVNIAFQAGTVIFCKGDPGDCMYVVQSG